MLNTMRKKASDSLTLKIVFGAIVVVFMFWGIGTVGMNQMEVVARVNDEVISSREFNRAYTNLQQTYRDTFPQGVPAELLQGQVLNQLINTELLRQEADRLGLRVDEDELRQSIAAIPAFQVDGRFSRDAYVQTLRLNNLKPSDFEDAERRQLLVNKLQDLIRAGVSVSDADARERFDYENERVVLRYVRIPASRFLDQVEVGEEDARAYLEKHQDDFREPERVRIRYVKFVPERFTDQVEPSEDDLQFYYDAHHAQFDRPAQIRARHILLKVAPGASPEEILARLRGGADFAEVARESSEDVTAAAGGDLGFFARGVMNEAFDTAAFALEPGAVSEVVETPFGFDIVKVEEKREAGLAPLDDVRDEVEAEVRTQLARQVALKKVEDAHDQLLDGKDLAAIAASFGLAMETPPPFSRDEAVAGVGQSRELSDLAFPLEPGEAGDIVTLDDGYVLFRVDDHIASHVPPFEEIRARVEAAVRGERAAEKARARAEELLAKLKGGEALESLAAGEGVAVEETGEIARMGGYVPPLGNLAPLKEAAFRLTPTQPVAPSVYDSRGDAVIAVLKERIPAKEEQFADQKENLRERIRRQREAVAVERFVSQLRAKADVRVDQALAGS